MCDDEIACFFNLRKNPALKFDHREQDLKPAELIRAAKELQLKGVIASARVRHVEPGRRSGAWLKSKINDSQEFVIGGYTFGNPSDALIVGCYEGGKLNVVSKVINGFVPHIRWRAAFVITAIHRGVDVPSLRICPRSAAFPELGVRRLSLDLPHCLIDRCAQRAKLFERLHAKPVRVAVLRGNDKAPTLRKGSICSKIPASVTPFLKVNIEAEPGLDWLFFWLLPQLNNS